MSDFVMGMMFMFCLLFFGLLPDYDIGKLKKQITKGIKIDIGDEVYQCKLVKVKKMVKVNE